LPKYQKLPIITPDCDKGTVEFDGPVIIPALYEKKKNDDGYRRNPWMSITPNEIMTLQPGTDLADGTVIIAGLGLGDQLIRVARKDSVDSIILVELSQEIVDWLLPILKEKEPILDKKLTKVIIGNAYDEIPKLTADVALIDIYPGYSDQSADYAYFEMNSPNINKIWLWSTEPDLKECSSCGERIEGDEEECVDCGQTFCPDCIVYCEECGNPLCINCESFGDGKCPYCQDREENDEEYGAGKLKKKITKKRVLLASGIATLLIAGFLTYNSEYMRRKFGWAPIYNPSKAYHEYMKWREEQ